MDIPHSRLRIRHGAYCCALLISAVLSACGGGGGGGNAGTANGAPIGDAIDPQNLSASNPSNSTSGNPASASSAGKLLISEIATNYYANDVAWFEVYNPGEAAVSLSGYALRSSYVDAGTAAVSLAPMTFALPDVAVPAKGYVVVASRVYDNLLDNQQIVYVNAGSKTPYWNANGSLELVKGGQTVDFVRLGASNAAPLTASEWQGANVSVLPSGVNEYGRSIVRLASGGMADTNTARDWYLVNFATPAGMNDVAPGVTDSDGDGVPDSAKVSGGTYAGLDLYAMGARRGRRDLFMEIDHMKSDDPGITPRREALQKVVDAFAEKNIAVHIDTGDLFSAGYDPAQFNLGGGDAVDFAGCIALAAASEDTAPGCTSLYDIKSRHFDVRRKFLFHYAVFANSLNPDGSGGSSGVAEMYGNDLIISLGNYGLSTAPGSALNLLINLQAGTLMHELGHNLGLRHGGNEDMNYKPNHYSVMNYMYQFAGLSATPNSVYAAERYYLANGLKDKTYCNLIENSPCSSDFKISYSDGSSSDLDENNLVESANIGRGSAPGAYADWNDDGALTAAGFARNIAPQNGSRMAVLHDYDEWDHLAFAFSHYFSGANTGAALANHVNPPRPNPMNQSPASKTPEDALPVALQNEIANTGASGDDDGHEHHDWHHRHQWGR